MLMRKGLGMVISFVEEIWMLPPQVLASGTPSRHLRSRDSSSMSNSHSHSWERGRPRSVAEFAP